MNGYKSIYITSIKDSILLYPILLGGGKNIGPYGSPPSYPHPWRQQKPLARGQNN